MKINDIKYLFIGIKITTIAHKYNKKSPLVTTMTKQAPDNMSDGLPSSTAQ